MEGITAVNNGHMTNGFHKTKQQLDEFCISQPVPAVAKGGEDPLNWAKSARAMEGSHLDEVKSFIKTFFESTEVRLEGQSLTVAHVAAIARRPEVWIEIFIKMARFCHFYLLQHRQK